MSSMMVLNTCTPIEVVTEEEITASSWIESSAEVASLATAEKRHFLNRF